MKKRLTLLAVALMMPLANASYNPNMSWFQQVAEGSVHGYSVMKKFGENPTITTSSDPEDVWDGDGIYTFSSTADISKMASSDDTDTQTIEVQGLDTNWTLTTQTKALTGQTVVTLDTPLVRVFRMKNIGATDIVGIVQLGTTDATWTDGEIDLSTHTRAQIIDGNNQTMMCIYTIPTGKTGYFYGGGVSMLRSAGTSALFSFRAREFGGVFQVKDRLNVVGTGTSLFNLEDTLIGSGFPEKTDLLIRCDEVEATTGVTGRFNILLKDN